MTEEDLHCSFCGKHRRYVQSLIAATDHFTNLQIHICDECVRLCNEIINSNGADINKSDEINI